MRTVVRPLRGEERRQLVEARRAIDRVLEFDAGGAFPSRTRYAAAVAEWTRARPALPRLAGGEGGEDDRPRVAGPVGLVLAACVPPAVRAATGLPLDSARDAERLRVLVGEVKRRLDWAGGPVTAGVAARVAVAAAGDLYPDWFGQA